MFQTPIRLHTSHKIWTSNLDSKKTPRPSPSPVPLRTGDAATTAVAATDACCSSLIPGAAGASLYKSIGCGIYS